MKEKETNKNKSNDKKVFAIAILLVIIFILIGNLGNNAEKNQIHISQRYEPCSKCKP